MFPVWTSHFLFFYFFTPPLWKPSPQSSLVCRCNYQTTHQCCLERGKKSAIGGHWVHGEREMMQDRKTFDFFWLISDIWRDCPWDSACWQVRMRLFPVGRGHLWLSPVTSVFLWMIAVKALLITSSPGDMVDYFDSFFEPVRLDICGGWIPWTLLTRCFTECRRSPTFFLSVISNRGISMNLCWSVKRGSSCLGLV